MEFCSNLDARWSLKQLDLSNAIEEVELSLPLFSLPLIANAFLTGIYHHVSVIDRPQSFPTGNTFAHGWPAQSLLSSSEKSVTPNAIVKHFSQMLLQMRYFCRLKTLNVCTFSNIKTLEFDWLCIVDKTG